MAVKTFTTGEVLTASDTNTYLNNGGLVYISSGLPSNVGSFDITGFTSTYTQFRVVMWLTRTTGTGGTAVVATFRDASSGYATGYYGCGFSMNYLGTTGAANARNNAVDFSLGTVYDNVSPMRAYFDIGGMNATTYRPNLTGSLYDETSSANIVFGYEYAGARTLNIDRIRVTCSQNMTGGWTLYGYRTA